MDYKAPDKQRMIDVLNHRKPDRVPNFEVLVDNPAFNTIMGRTVTGLDGNHTLANIDPQDYIEFVKKIGQDVIGMCFYSLPFYYKDDNGNRRHVDYVIKTMKIWTGYFLYRLKTLHRGSGFLMNTGKLSKGPISGHSPLLDRY